MTKQKENISLRIAKIALVIALITGLGTIIFGGGVVIMKYYGNEANNRTVKPVNQETGLNIVTDDQNLIFEKILCEPEKDYVFSYDIEGNKLKLPCRDCPSGYIFQTNHTSFRLTSELGISHKTEIKSCVKIKYRTINELNEKDIEIGNYSTEGYIVWESTCKGINRAERSACAVKPKEIIISKNNETIDNETELTNNQLRIINPGDKQIEIGGKYRFLLRLEEIGSDDNKFKYFEGIRFEKIEDNQLDTSDWQTYRNEEFGFEVKYPKNDSFSKYKIKQIGNTFYIAFNDYKDVKDGQFVTIFAKDSEDSLKQAIEKKFLKNFSKEDCFVNERNIGYLYKYPENYIVLSAIDYPERGKYPLENKDNCPYAIYNGKSYFLMDSNHPDKFAYFSIGQYSIPAALEGVEIFWQDTFKFIEK